MSVKKLIFIKNKKNKKNKKIGELIKKMLKISKKGKFQNVKLK